MLRRRIAEGKGGVTAKGARVSEASKARSREWRKENPERVRELKKRYYEKHKEKVKAKVRAWHYANLDRARASARRKALAKMGTTPEERAQRLTEQNGCCAICLAPFKDSRNTHTDHDHRTGLFRALLCTKCNNGLGVIEREGGTWLWGAMKYLVQHGNGDFAWAYEPEDCQ